MRGEGLYKFKINTYNFANLNTQTAILKRFIIKSLPNNLAINRLRKELENVSQIYKAISVMAAKKILNLLI